MISDEEVRLVYGRAAIISRKRRFVLVHLDRPSRALVRARTREFNPNEFFDEDCPVCKLQKKGGIVVFDDSPEDIEVEDILID